MKRALIAALLAALAVGFGLYMLDIELDRRTGRGLGFRRGAGHGDESFIRQGAGRVDEVLPTGVYPTSAESGAPSSARAQGMASWGQGDRGAAGYEDSGGSELSGLK